MLELLSEMKAIAVSQGITALLILIYIHINMLRCGEAFRYAR